MEFDKDLKARQEARALARRAQQAQLQLRTFSQGQLDAIVLGCTHYPFVSRRIGKVLGPETMLLHGGKGTARETKRRLEQAGLLQEGPGQVRIISSDPDPAVTDLAWKLLNG